MADPSDAVSDTRIKLLVGGRLFHTTKQTLVSESSYFASLLSGRWTPPLEDGAYFVDADPSLFEHILRYLRHSIFPLFYDQARGHDLGLYVGLLGEATYFGIERLQKWLEDKEYLKAVRMECSMRVIDDWDKDIVIAESDTVVELHPRWDTKKVYLCPRRIYVHRGDPLRCGRQCQNAKGDDDTDYEDEPVFKVAVMKKKTVLRADVCVPGEV
ncbi:hypothetical protein E4U55_007996 [Claviceps digitariae]|nr:hypothetical protein E4U55_007996 [Claviceps digitariae]